MGELKMDKPKVVIGIPARMGSTRFPGKPLCKILGVPMIEHVYRRCLLAKGVDQVFVGACDEEIRKAVESFKGSVIMTDPTIPRPGLRVAVASQSLDLADEDIVVVVQGDEPLVHPDMIDLALEPLLKEKDILVSNLVEEIKSDAEWQDPNVVKVVTDLEMNAIYMSRSPIPSNDYEEEPGKRLVQVCIMPFRWHFLRTFNELNPTPLEKAESIEMIRAIQHGYKVRMVHSHYISKSVDTETERQEVENLMRKDPIWPLYKEQCNVTS